MSQSTLTWKYHRALTNDEARSEARSFCASTEENFQYLRHQCRLNGNAILKRWKKYKPEERKALILTVSPDIHPKKWIDVELYLEYISTAREIKAALDNHDTQRGLELFDSTEGRQRRKFRDALLLPYINLEELTQDPWKALSLIYVRSTHSPAVWATYDNASLDKDWNLGSFDTTYNGGCVVMKGSAYGKWTTWGKHSVHSGCKIGYPRAVLVLELQQKLMAFLRGLVDGVLGGITRIDIIPQSENFNNALEKGLVKNMAAGSTVKYFRSPYLNQSFSAPPAFDLDEIESIAQARLADLGDHLWLLQTDATYLREYSKLLKEGGLKDNLGNSETNIMTAIYVLDDPIRYWQWEGICEEIANVRVAQSAVLCQTGRKDSNLQAVSTTPLQVDFC